MATAAVVAVFTNALYLQKGPHPAPIFAKQSMIKQAQPVAQPVIGSSMATTNRTQLVTDIQKELVRRGFYDGALDGIWGAKTDAATRDFVQITGAKINPEASDALLQALMTSQTKALAGRPGSPEAARNDPIAELIVPARRVLAIQRALADFGYGQIKPTGAYDMDTRTAIEKFEREHRLPVTGQLSDRFVRELAAMTGRPLE